MSEGWGLIAFEHAATGGAQIVPDHSASGELWAGVAELLPSSPLELSLGSASGGEVQVVDVAAALERLYADPMELKIRSDLAMKRALHPDLSWAAVAARFNRLLIGILG